SPNFHLLLIILSLAETPWDAELLSLIDKGPLICSNENATSQFVGGLVIVLQTGKLSSTIFEEGTVSILVSICPLQSSTDT
ncbi:MAG: hypothetical protein WKF91_01655, partial [Segetibacter sp.]